MNLNQSYKGIIIGIIIFIIISICISSCFFTCIHFYKNREKCILKIYTDEKKRTNTLKKEDYKDRKKIKVYNKKERENEKDNEEEKILETINEINKEFEIKII